jgi:hypothetical protein
MSTDTKPSNPKDMIGGKKLPLHLVPPAVNIYASLAFLEGALKYGKFNWRVAGVRFSIYLDAVERHLAKLADGEWCDPETKVPHLANIIACCGIILDAKQNDKLTDDRAPAALRTSALIDGLQGNVAHLQDLFKAHNPTQYTIEYKPDASPTPTKKANTNTSRRPRKSRR